ncbi:MAG: fasciclin domain-containing protein [Bryobacteraceae bacterium]
MKKDRASCAGPMNMEPTRMGSMAWAWQCSGQAQRPRPEASKATTTESAAAKPALKSLLETAAGAGNFTVLAKAIDAAGLTDLLASKGPFTVFAPTDAAFSAVPQETLMDLLKPENKAKLRAVLRYHVVPGNYRAAEVAGMSAIPTLEGQSAAVRTESGSAFVANVKIAQADLQASNGNIHVLDGVMMP